MDFANEIRNRLDTQEVFSNYGLRPNRSGFVCCFSHNEKTPSMKVYKGNGGYHCFGCGAHGSIIDFVMQYFGLSFKEAIIKINEDFSLGLPIDEKLDCRKQLEMQKQAFLRKREMNARKAKLIYPNICGSAIVCQILFGYVLTFLYNAYSFGFRVFRPLTYEEFR